MAQGPEGSIVTNWRRGSAGITAALKYGSDPSGEDVHAVSIPWESARTHASEGGSENQTGRGFVPVPDAKPLDVELVDQLGQPAGLKAIVDAGITADLAREILGNAQSVEIAADVLSYVYDHRDRHGVLPKTEVILHHLGYQPFGEPSFETGEFLRQWKHREMDIRGRRGIKDLARTWRDDPDAALRTFHRMVEEFDRRTHGINEGVVITPLASVEYQPVSWLWEDFIPTRAVTILSGEPGVNKSTLAFGIAAGLSTGKSGVPANSLILTTEDSYQMTVVPRLRAAGADMSRIFALEKRRNGLIGHLQFPEDLSDLYKAVKAYDARLVVIDPLMGHLSGNVDSWKEQSIRRIMSELYHIADETDCAVLSINHLTKNINNNALNRVGGSMGIVAASRSVLLMGKNPDDESQRVLSSTKLNISKAPPARIYALEGVTIDTPDGPVESMRLKFVTTTELTSDEVLRAHRKTALEKADQLLYELLDEDGDPVQLDTIKERAAAEGINWRNVQQARTNIARIVTERDEAGATTWALRS